MTPTPKTWLSVVLSNARVRLAPGELDRLAARAVSMPEIAPLFAFDPNEPAVVREVGAWTRYAIKQGAIRAA